MKNIINTPKEIYPKLCVYKVSLVREKTLDMFTMKLGSPQGAITATAKIFEALDRECMVLIFLDVKNMPLGVNIVSVGTLSSSLVHPREVFKAAIIASAHSIILLHNHPSGDPSPSEDDIITTKRIEDAGQLIGINLLDHIIIGEGDNYYSFKEKGAL
jgi:DNA repair protein RadC